MVFNKKLKNWKEIILGDVFYLVICRDPTVQQQNIIYGHWIFKQNEVLPCFVSETDIESYKCCMWYVITPREKHKEIFDNKKNIFLQYNNVIGYGITHS